MDYNEQHEEHITKEDFILDEKEEKKRRREERRRRKHYKFTDKKHSSWGIGSLCCLLAALICLAAALVLATGTRGHAGSEAGYLCGASFASSLIGLIVGLFAFRQVDVKYRFAWIGIICNGIVWLITATILVIGV